MKKIIATITISSLLFTSFVFPQGTPVSDREGIQKPGQARVPKALREDGVMLPLIEAFNADRTAFRTEFQELRQQLTDAAEEDRAAIRESLRELLKSNFQAQRDFRRAMRERMKELREAAQEE